MAGSVRGRRQAQREQPAETAQRDQGRGIPLVAGGLQERHPAGHQEPRRRVRPLLPAPRGVPARAGPPQEEAAREEARLPEVQEEGPVSGRVPHRQRHVQGAARRGPRRRHLCCPPEDRPDPDARAIALRRPGQVGRRLAHGRSLVRLPRRRGPRGDPARKSHAVVGVDLGVATLATISDDRIPYEAPRPLKTLAKKRRRLGRPSPASKAPRPARRSRRTS